MSYTETTYKPLIPKIFRHDRYVFIVGGGASLSDFDFKELDGKQHIAVNSAIFYCKNADMGFFGDGKFHSKFAHSLWRFRKGDDKKRLFTYDTTPLSGISGVRDEHIDKRIVQLSKTDGSYFTKSKDVLPDNICSGLAAINLAYHAGARKIALLGFDGKRMSGKSNFHENKSWGHNSKAGDEALMQMASAAQKMNDEIESLGVDLKIVNLSDESVIECFEKKPMDNFFN